MGWYVYYDALYLGFMLLFHFMKKVKRNPTFGVRFKATLADEEVWEATQKRAADIMYVVCPAFLALNTVFYLLGLPSSYATVLFFVFAGVALAETAYLYFYSKNLLEQKKKEGKIIEEEKFKMPKWFAVFMFVTALFLAVSGIVMCFIKPNPLMGVRISKTFQSIYVWRKVNTFSGIGLSVIGIVFAYLFSEHLKGIKNDKIFLREVYYYIGATLLWAAISVAYAYLI